ncbi:hypothetical protein QBC34DRAFT_114418 [Podospora aff. communis PSN243]|uniref:Uncharacterized protein n=1 Tax=Podospora aff. communis PSN243 TaxID=3040156 RepID=A0AAV9GJM6_9PEZI|nr:hypothetical protein QBC34DRAFT_114418 [Podospora aff. communis PSN243]
MTGPRRTPARSGSEAPHQTFPPPVASTTTSGRGCDRYHGLLQSHKAIEGRRPWHYHESRLALSTVSPRCKTERGRLSICHGRRALECGEGQGSPMDATFVSGPLVRLVGPKRLRGFRFPQRGPIPTFSMASFVSPRGRCQARSSTIPSRRSGPGLIRRKASGMRSGPSAQPRAVQPREIEASSERPDSQPCAPQKRLVAAWGRIFQASPVLCYFLIILPHSASAISNNKRRHAKSDLQPRIHITDERRRNSPSPFNHAPAFESNVPRTSQAMTAGFGSALAPKIASTTRCRERNTKQAPRQTSLPQTRELAQIRLSSTLNDRLGSECRQLHQQTQQNPTQPTAATHYPFD